MSNKQMKYENPMRLQELNPMETLRRIGLQERDVLCDIGAGSGVFTLPAANITRGRVYALDINEEMLSVIDEKAKTENLQNIELVHVEGSHFNLLDHSINVVLLVTVLHEIDSPKIFLDEVKRVLVKDGKVAIIEFHKRSTPMGPPIGHRIDKEEVVRLLSSIELKVQEEFELGENFYCMVFQES